MKKLIMALVCLTVSVAMMAQPEGNGKKDFNRQGRQNAGMQRRSASPDIMVMKMIGVDSTKVKAVKELKHKQMAKAGEDAKAQMKARMEARKEYNKELRQILGDDKYIEYLEATIAMQQRQQMRRGMPRVGMHQRGQGNRFQRKPMMWRKKPAADVKKDNKQPEKKDKKSKK